MGKNLILGLIFDSLVQIYPPPKKKKFTSSSSY